MFEALFGRYQRYIVATLSGLILLGSGIALGTGLSQVKNAPPTFETVGLQEDSGGLTDDVLSLPKEVSPLNLNTAGSSDLQNLPGIGPVKAQSIVDYRSSNGAFHSKEDIVNVSGIGPKTFQRIKDLITVE